MAWISLTIIILIFFIPGIDFCQSIMANNISLSIPIGDLAVAVTIPFTGPIKLFLIIGLNWLFVWICLYIATFHMERTSTSFRKLFITILVPIHPKFCLQTPIYLAKITLLFAGFKALIFLISVIFADSLLPILLKVPLFQSDLMQWLINVFLEGSDWINRMDSPWLVSAFVLSLLILIVERVSRWEKKVIVRKNLQLNYKEQRKKQNKIIIPATQQ